MRTAAYAVIGLVLFGAFGWVVVMVLAAKRAARSYSHDESKILQEVFERGKREDAEADKETKEVNDAEGANLYDIARKRLQRK